MRPHECRHSYITHMRAAGVNDADLAEIAGHRVATMLARYTHATKKSFGIVRDLLGEESESNVATPPRKFRANVDWLHSRLDSYGAFRAKAGGLPRLASGIYSPIIIRTDSVAGVDSL